MSEAPVTRTCKHDTALEPWRYHMNGVRRILTAIRALTPTLPITSNGEPVRASTNDASPYRFLAVGESMTLMRATGETVCFADRAAIPGQGIIDIVYVAQNPAPPRPGEYAPEPFRLPGALGTTAFVARPWRGWAVQPLPVDL